MWAGPDKCSIQPFKGIAVLLVTQAYLLEYDMSRCMILAMVLALIGECHAELPGCVQRVEFSSNKKGLEIGLVYAVECGFGEVQSATVQWKLVRIFEQCKKILWRLPDRQGLEIWADMACQLQNSWMGKGELRYVQIRWIRLPGYLTYKGDGLLRNLYKHRINIDLPLPQGDLCT